MDSKKSKVAMLIALAALALGCILLCVQLVDMKREAAAHEAQEKIWSERYLRQNTAFGLDPREYYLPYTAQASEEMFLYARVCYYNHMTGSDLELDEIYDFLSSPDERVPVVRPARRNYEEYPRIKAFVDFMWDAKAKPQEPWLDRNGMTQYVPRYEAFFLECLETLNQVREEYPEFAHYTFETAPMELMDEIVHKTVDPSYEIDLAIEDERCWRYLPPEVTQ